MGRLVRGLRERLGLPAFFTLDSCRHGGMTELKEAELTDGQGRALSTHRSKAYGALPSAPKSALWPRPESATRTGSRSRKPPRTTAQRHPEQTAHVNFRNETDPEFQKFPDNAVSKVA